MLCLCLLSMLDINLELHYLCMNHRHHMLLPHLGLLPILQRHILFLQVSLCLFEVLNSHHIFLFEQPQKRHHLPSRRGGDVHVLDVRRGYPEPFPRLRHKPADDLVVYFAVCYELVHGDSISMIVLKLTLYNKPHISFCTSAQIL